MASKKNFEILAEMADKNLDIRMSLSFVSAQAVKAGGLVTVGVDRKVVNDLVFGQGKYHVILIVANQEEYEKIKNS